MKITILGPAHPYRGGLASILEIMARTFLRRGDDVDIKTFTLQYPSLLFPGESQTVATPPPADLRIRRCVNTVNPLNWLSVGRTIRRERPDFVLLKYWTPFMAPCFRDDRPPRPRQRAYESAVPDRQCRTARTPPFRPAVQPLFSFVRGRFHLHVGTGAPRIAGPIPPRRRSFSPHPLFENFGERVPRAEACGRLGLDPALRYVLSSVSSATTRDWTCCSGAWALLKRRGRTEGRRLIVAGEFYTAKEPYLKQIAASGLQEEVLLHDRFIPDAGVKDYFSAADFVVQPYKTATQSGVTQIAYQFCTPMVVTDVGGLAEIVPRREGGGMSAPRPRRRSPRPSNGFPMTERWRFSAATASGERRRFSWERMCDRVTELYGSVSGTPER